MAEQEAAPSTFGHLINSILKENNGKILAKYKQTTSKHQRVLLQKFEDKKSQKRKATERRDMMDECHITPTIVDNARDEKIMRKMATFGVVALFKAVAKHQRDLKRSLGDIDAEEDVLDSKTMLIEHRSTKRLLSTLNESSSSSAAKLKGAMIETSNPYKSYLGQNKKRKLSHAHDSSQRRPTLPKHLQSILLDKNSTDKKRNYDDDDEDSDVGGNDTDHRKLNKSKQWNVLDEDMFLNKDAHNAHPDLEDFEDELGDEVDDGGIPLDSD